MWIFTLWLVAVVNQLHVFINKSLHIYSSKLSLLCFLGASASTLQDIKIPDSCGGFTYIDSGISQTTVRNRFIYW